ncbi:hypothetical protein M4D55_07385 [Metabacillus idriensis]|uniref:hypothetical protein n=1 Tax=Metabacillus idriensis TaxID=324768 RepID=UPI002041D322|nr:hypothetical protein [Metabacillus idriensis]MCM3595605.1 hypothetical protein [Metabacillus idriensis]
MKKNFKTYALLIVLIFTTIAIIDNLRISNVAEELQKDKDNLVKQVANFEQDLGNSSSNLKELKRENELLTDDISNLEKDIEDLKSPVTYQDFLNAISTVESYKDVESFNKTSEFYNFFSSSKNIGFSPKDSAGNCPCSVGKIEWMPNSVLELREFRIDKERIFLTYNTVEKIKNDYQFVMIKTKESYDNVERWRIEEINLKGKEN